MEKYARAFNIDISELLEISHIKPQEEILDDLIHILKTVNNNDLTTIYKIVKDIVH